MFLERKGGSCGLDDTGNSMSESSFQAVTATVILLFASIFWEENI